MTETGQQDRIAAVNAAEAQGEPQAEAQAEPQNEAQGEPQNEAQGEPQAEAQGDPQDEPRGGLRLSKEDQADLTRREREARKEIRVMGDPVLREHAREVTSFDRPLRKLAKRMIRIMHDAPGVGLAAPQIGVLQRLLVYDVDDDPQVLVNPVLDEFDDEREEAQEGCLSVPGVTMPVERPVSVRVRGFDGDGEPLDFIAEGFEARVIQHEFDHLEGVLIVDRTSRSARAAAIRELASRRDAGLTGAVGGGL